MPSRPARPDRVDVSVSALSNSMQNQNLDETVSAGENTTAKHSSSGMSSENATTDGSRVSCPVFRPVELTLAKKLDVDGRHSGQGDRRFGSSWHTEDGADDIDDDELCALDPSRASPGLPTPGRESLLCTSDDEVSEDDGRYSDVSDGERHITCRRVPPDHTDIAIHNSLCTAADRILLERKKIAVAHGQDNELENENGDSSSISIDTENNIAQESDQFTNDSSSPCFVSHTGSTTLEVSNVSSAYSARSQDEKNSVADISKEAIEEPSDCYPDAPPQKVKVVIDDDDSDDSCVGEQFLLNINTSNNSPQDVSRDIVPKATTGSSAIAISHGASLCISREHTSSPEPMSISTFPRSRDSSIKWRRPPVKRSVVPGLQDSRRPLAGTAPRSSSQGRHCAPSSASGRQPTGLGFRRSEHAQESAVCSGKASSTGGNSSNLSRTSHIAGTVSDLGSSNGESQQSQNLPTGTAASVPPSYASHRRGFGRNAIRRLTRRFAPTSMEKNHQCNVTSHSATSPAPHYGSSHSLLSYMHTSCSSNVSSSASGPPVSSKSFSQGYQDKCNDTSSGPSSGGAWANDREMRARHGHRPANHPGPLYYPFDEYMISESAFPYDVDQPSSHVNDVYGVRPEPHSFGGWRSRPCYGTDTSSVGSSDCGESKNMSQGASMRRLQRSAAPSSPANS